MNGQAHDRLHPSQHHLLLTVLGTNSNTLIYSLLGREREAKLAPVALLDLLPATERPDSVLAICTPEAKQHSFPLLRRALQGKCQVNSIDIPIGDAQEDIYAFLESVTTSVPAKAELTVDITHGYRHFAFLTYSALLYLQAVHGVRVLGAYYGLLREDRPSPFLDLRPLLELPQWTHALEVLSETGSALPMAELLANASSSQDAQAMAGDLTRLSEAYLAGLPLEFGRYASGVNDRRRSMRRLLHNKHRLPLADDLTKRLTRILQPMALETAGGQGWKGTVALTRAELKRQADMIDDLLRRENYAVAFSLLREWTVSWISWRRGEGGAWLDHRVVRRGSEGLLSAMAAVANDPELCRALTEEQRNLGHFWNQLGAVRNGYAHHGMRPQVLVGDDQLARMHRAVSEFWKDLKSLPDVATSLGNSPGSRILVSPIGKRPGVLFSALHAARENGKELDLCLAICSKETEGEISQAAERAGYDGECVPLVFEDAFAGGSQQITALVKSAKKRLIGAAEVMVNVTGGTTLMGLAAERLAAKARLLACPVVRRFGLIDHRLPQEQGNDPYRVGEPFWLDEEGQDASRD